MTIRFSPTPAWRRQLLTTRTELSSADLDDITAQIDPIGVPWLMIGEELSAAPNGGCARHFEVQADHAA
jgi:hypothetical protein